MSLNTKFDVIVVGAGPIGSAMASILSSIHPAPLKIAVLDDREKTTRDYGLKVGRDSIDFLQEILKKYPNSNTQSMETLFEKWRSRFVRVNEIQTILIEKAKELGIEVLLGKDYRVTEENLGNLPTEIVIGADGAHSTVRKTVMEDQRVGVKAMEYILELKFETEGKTRPRSIKEASFASSTAGDFNFESMSEYDPASSKPVTYRMFISKETFQNLRKEERGTFKKPWSLQELEDIAKDNTDIAETVEKIDQYLEYLRSRGGECINGKISVLPLEIYRSKESVKFHQGKAVVLAGDSNSGLILYRGFNKGLKEAALCAQAVSNYILTKDFSHLANYQAQTHALFANEAWWAEFKDFWIRAGRVVLQCIRFPITLIKSIFRTIFQRGRQTSLDGSLQRQ
jgi:2-polyprenyl-6-methoxyphenol hydroxylase-like FAD-dependent oxidoreductase